MPCGSFEMLPKEVLGGGTEFCDLATETFQGWMKCATRQFRNAAIAIAGNVAMRQFRNAIERG